MTDRTFVRVFGRVLVEQDGRVLVPPRGHAREALAMVVVRGPTNAEVLAEMLWPDEPFRATAHRLRKAVALLRVACGPVLARDGALIYLDGESDLATFRALVRAGDLDGATALAAAGELAAEWPFAEWCADARREVAAALDTSH